jgi:uncharacterized protein (TIGR03084 family)
MQQATQDLLEERSELIGFLEAADPEAFDLPTPSEPWLVRDQVSHLAFFDEEAIKAATDTDAFFAGVAQMAEVGADVYMDQHIARGREMEPADLIAWLRRTGDDLVAALEDRDPDERIPWYGPPMRARSFVIARLMETWAHGQDVVDALGVDRLPTDRLFHIAELGIRTFRFSYENRGLEVPDERVRVALRGPTGTVKVWNDEYSNSVTGPLEDFCLVVTQRRHLGDTHLVMEGPIAREWMSIAQAFAGPPGPGRRSRSWVG